MLNPKFGVSNPKDTGYESLKIWGAKFIRFLGVSPTHLWGAEPYRKGILKTQSFGVKPPNYGMLNPKFGVFNPKDTG